MAIRVSAIEPSEQDVVFQTLRRAAQEQATLFFVVCVDDRKDLDKTETIGALVDEARRRASDDHVMHEQLCVADLRMDRNRYEVSRAGRPIHLSPMEYTLLEFLMLHHDRALSEEDLMRSVFRGTAKNGRFNTLWVHIHRLRRKVDQHGGARLIHTIKGVGYIMKTPVLGMGASA